MASGTAAVTYYGIDGSDSAGRGIAVGDLNSDGLDDLAIGAENAERAGETSTTNRGEVYVFFAPTNITGAVNSSSANVTYYGINASHRTGTAVAIGDINNDSFADLIISVPYADALGGEGSQTGEVYVFLSPRPTNGVVNVSTANVTFLGAFQVDFTGFALATGDLNNDTVTDLVIGATGAELADEAGGSNNRGKAYVVFGPIENTGTRDMSTANVTYFGIDGGDMLGYGTAVGDVNNDGFNDLALGAFTAEGAGGSPAGAGEIYIFYGPINASGQVNASIANVTYFGIDGDDFAGKTTTGDINNDGVDDLIISAPAAEGIGGSPASSGETYIFFGPTPASGTVNLSRANITFYTDATDNSGIGLATGDITSDGITDFVIGAFYAEGAGGPDDAGEVYVIPGPLRSISNYDLMINKKGRIVISFVNESGKGVALQSQQPINRSRWTLVAGVIDRTNNRMYVYINETRWNTTISGSAVTNSVNLTIGSSLDGVGAINGTLDEVRLFSRALGGEEINASFNASLYRLFHNFTNLNNGTYNYSAYAIDTAGNLVISSPRRVTIDTTVVADISFLLFVLALNATGVQSTTEMVNVTQTILFNYTALDLVKGNASVLNGTIQDKDQAVFRYRSTASTAINISMNFTTNVSGRPESSSIVIKAGWAENAWQDSCAVTNLSYPNTTCANITVNFTGNWPPVRIANLSTTGAAGGKERDVWLWVDWYNMVANFDQTATITHYSNESG